MADNDNSENLELNTLQAQEALKDVTKQAKALRVELKKAGDGLTHADFTKGLSKAQKDLKQIDALTKVFRAALSSSQQKFASVTNETNKAIEKTSSVLAVQARQFERAETLVKSIARLKAGEQIATSFTKAKEATDAYNAGLKKLQQLLAQVDKTGAYAQKTKAQRELVKEVEAETIKVAELLNLTKQLNVAERERGAAAKKASTEEAAALRTLQRDSNSTFASRKAARIADAKAAAEARRAEKADNDGTFRANRTARQYEIRRVAAAAAADARNTREKNAEAALPGRIRSAYFNSGAGRAQQLFAQAEATVNLIDKLRLERQAVEALQKAEIRQYGEATYMAKQYGAEIDHLNNRIKGLRQGPVKPGPAPSTPKDPQQSLTQRFGQNVRTFANYAVLGAAFGGVAGTATEIVKLDEALHNLQGITDTSDASMGKLRETILKTAAGSKFLSSELADAATVLGQAGLSVSQIAVALPAVATFAQASGIKLEESVNLITSAMGAFNLRADESINVANLFTAALNFSKLTVEQLSQGFQYSATAAAQLNIGYAELATTMALMANAGIKSGSMIGTGIRQIINQLSEPNAKLKQILLSLNVPLDSINLKTHGLLVVMKNLKDAGFSATEAFEAFGTRGAGAFIALQNQLSHADEIEKSIVGTQAAVKAAETQMKSFANISKNAFASFTALAAKAFDPFLNVLKLVVGGLGALLQHMQLLSPVIAVVATALAVLAAGKAISYVWGLTGAMGALGRAITTVRYMGIGALFTPMGIAIAAVSAAVVALSYAFTASARAQSEHKRALEEATGAAEKEKKQYEQIASETQNLINKEHDLRTGKASLTALTIQLGEKFQELGLDVRGLTNDYDGLLAKMLALRGASLKEQEVSLGNLRSAQSAVLNDERGNLRKQVRGVQTSAREGIYGAGSKLPEVAAFLSRTKEGSSGLGSVAGDSTIVLNAAVAAGRAGNDPLRKALDNVYQQLKEVFKAEQSVSKIGDQQSAVSIGQRGGFQSFQTNTQKLLGDIVKNKPEQGGLDARDAVEYAKKIDKYVTENLNKLQVVSNALDSFSRASKGNALALDNSGLRTLVTNSIADLNVLRDSSTRDAKAQRVAIGSIDAKDASAGLSTATDELSRAETQAEAEKAGRRMRGYAVVMMNAELEKYAAEVLQLRQSEYTVSGGQLKANSKNLTVTDAHEIASFNSRNSSQLRNYEGDVNARKAALADKEIKNFENDTTKGMRAAMRTAGISIENWLKKVTSDFKNIDKYAPPSAVDAAMRNQLADLVRWYNESAARIILEKQMRIKALSPGHGINEETAIKEAAQQQKDELDADYARRRGDVGTNAQNALNDSGRLANGYGDAWRNIQQAGADPRRTKSQVNEFATTFQDVMISAIDAVRTNMAQMFMDFATNAKTAGQAFAGFAKGILQAILQTLANKAAQSFVNLLLSFAPGGGIGKKDGGSIPGLAVGGMVKGNMPTRDSVMMGLPPGSFVMRQSATRRLNFASGGRVPVNVMPGERIFHPDEVAAIGLKNLRAFNGASSGSSHGLMSYAAGGEVGNTMARAAGKTAMAFADGISMPKAKPSHPTNVYVVHQDVAPPMTPHDVLVTVTADILKNGQTKKLIKSITRGG